jgi:hypothetical protein
MYYLQCQVREGVLKFACNDKPFKQLCLREDGKVIEFVTEEEAQREADRLNATLGWEKPLHFWEKPLHFLGSSEGATSV